MKIRQSKNKILPFSRRQTTYTDTRVTLTLTDDVDTRTWPEMCTCIPEMNV